MPSVSVSSSVHYRQLLEYIDADPSPPVYAEQ